MFLLPFLTQAAFVEGPLDQDEQFALKLRLKTREQLQGLDLIQATEDQV